MSTQAETRTMVMRLPRPKQGRGRRVDLALQAAVLVAAVLLWWYGSASLPTGLMPSPAETVVTLGELVTTAAFWSAVGETMLTFVIALLICSVLGIVLGLAIGSSRFLTGSTRLVLDFVRTIPPIAILPVALLLYGPTFQMVLVLVVLGALWPILIQSIYAATQGEALLRDMSRSFRMPRWWFITRVFLPGALPFIMTGLRVGTTICLLLTITGELLGDAPGIGAEIQNAQTHMHTSQMYAYVLVSAIIGLLVNLLFWRLQRQVLHWHASIRGGE